jgi:uncharacterized protein (DUF2235 family)
MKRLVVCCDGTWNSADRPAVSNVEKIALAVKTNQPVSFPGPTSAPVSSARVQQEVLYVTGVGTHGYLADRVLGGAVGAGLTANVNEAYRWLCVNYDPGDEIFLFGFSRGAYTARSVGGMIAAVGVLDLARLDRAGFGATLLEAETVYRTPTDTQAQKDARSKKAADFRRQHARADVTIRFVGVFDTVGALGIPGPARHRMKFHDVTLGPTVEHARQALAIDERRMTFEPCIWTIDPTLPAEKRPQSVEQVWFEGVHSDVGGGYKSLESGLSQFSLAWMMTEAAAKGLIFDPATLIAQFDPDARTQLHDSLSPLYKVVNLVRNADQLLARSLRSQHKRGGGSGTSSTDAASDSFGSSELFRDSRRVLARTHGPHAEQYLFLASTARERYKRDTYKAPNIGWWYDLGDNSPVAIAEVGSHPTLPTSSPR